MKPNRIFRGLLLGKNALETNTHEGSEQSECLGIRHLPSFRNLIVASLLFNQLSAQDLILDPNADRQVLDFGSNTSAVAPGAFLVSPSSGGAVDWSGSVSAGIGSGDELARDWVSATGNRTLKISVPPGIWTARMMIGHGSSAINNLSINGEDSFNVNAGEQKEVVFSQHIESDHEVLTINFETTGLWAIRSLELDNGRLRIDPNATVYQYDACGNDHPVEAGYTRLAPGTWGDVYWSEGVRSMRKGFGVLSMLDRDVVWEGSNTPGKLTHKLTNGTWRVEGTAGTPYQPIANMTVRAEGQTIASGISLARERTADFSGQVTVTDGKLDLVFDGNGTNWGLTTLKLTQLNPDPTSVEGLSSGGSLDGWNSNMVIDESRTQENSLNELILVTPDRFRFYAGRVSGPVTPFAVRVLADNSFIVEAIGTPRTNYRVGFNDFAFSDKWIPGVRLQPGEKMTVGFLDANPDGSGGALSVIHFQNSNDEIFYTGGATPADSGSVSLGLAPQAGTNTITSLRRTYAFTVDLKVAGYGNSSSGHDPIARPTLDGWKSMMVVSKGTRYTNSSNRRVFVNPNTFSFYAQRSGSPVTPFMARDLGENNYQVVAVGDPVESYKVGSETHVSFAKRKLPVVAVEPGETIAFAFLAARPDGSGVTQCPIPFTNGGDALFQSGGPGTSNSPKVTTGSFIVPGDNLRTQNSRRYSFSISYTVSDKDDTGGAEEDSVVIYRTYGRSNLNYYIREGHASIADREGNRYGSPDYPTCRLTLSNTEARLGQSSYVAETHPYTAGPKQRTEMEPGGFSWASEDQAEGYWGFSFRIDPNKWPVIPGDVWFNLGQFNQQSIGAPGMAAFHQIIKLQFSSPSGDSRPLLRAQLLHGDSATTTQTYQGTNNFLNAGTLDKGQWYDLVLGFKFDTSGANNGFVKLWLKKANETNYGSPVTYNGQVGFIGGQKGIGSSIGMYKKAENVNRRLYLDEIRRGSTFESVSILTEQSSVDHASALVPATSSGSSSEGTSNGSSGGNSDGSAGESSSQSPLGGSARSITSVIQSEDYDNGGQGVAYNDSNTANNGGKGRTGEGVDLENTTDTGGGLNVGWTANGEWLEYTVNAAAGTYTIEARTASNQTNPGKIQVSLNGSNLGTIPVGGTGGWQKWQTSTLSNVTIPATSNGVIRLTMVGSGINLNWFRFVGNAAPQTVNFTSSEDAYLQNGTRYNNNLLRVEKTGRVREAFLKFKVTGVSANVTGVKLRIAQSSDTASGASTIAVYKATTNNWTEASLSNTNKPARGALLGTKSGPFSGGAVAEINLGSNAVSGNGDVSLIIVMSVSGEDVAFSSKEGTADPVLEVTYQ